jgi:hypothetical protein
MNTKIIAIFLQVLEAAKAQMHFQTVKITNASMEIVTSGEKGTMNFAPRLNPTGYTEQVMICKANYKN